ncbi:diacylglycerol kinase catalytic domain-containing protein [Paenibacillus jiagnxiensis]|uniref:sugar kinase n=1 Tax=Paenibacillus jiagnxiensis TaxID=3228926 RepID=UPI0033B671DE
MKQRMTEEKIVLIKRRTRLEELVARYNTISQAEFYIRRLGADFSDYAAEDQTYQKAVSQALTGLESLGRVQVIDREHVPNFIFGEQDIVVVLGQDGLVANTMKYLEEQPLIGVNPDPLRWDGVLLPFSVKDLGSIVRDVMAERRLVKEVVLAKAELNDGQTLYGVNDLFIGRKTHVSARYELTLANHTERQSSSGIIVSTGLGATGWLKSVLAGATGIAGSLAYSEAAVVPGLDLGHFHCDSSYLLFTVREPFPSRSTEAGLVFGKIDAGNPLRIVSQMPENGVIFSDGVEDDFLEFNSGVEVRIGLAERKGRLIV